MKKAALLLAAVVVAGVVAMGSFMATSTATIGGVVSNQLGAFVENLNN